MKPTLKPGLTHSFSYKVPENKTVPFTYPKSPITAQMPTHLDDMARAASAPIWTFHIWRRPRPA